MPLGINVSNHTPHTLIIVNGYMHGQEEVFGAPKAGFPGGHGRGVSIRSNSPQYYIFFWRGAPHWRPSSSCGGRAATSTLRASNCQISAYAPYRAHLQRNGGSDIRHIPPVQKGGVVGCGASHVTWVCVHPAQYTIWKMPLGNNVAAQLWSGLDHGFCEASGTIEG